MVPGVQEPVVPWELGPVSGLLGALTRHWTTTPCKGRVAGCGARRVRRAAGAARGGCGARRVKRGAGEAGAAARWARWARWARPVVGTVGGGARSVQRATTAAVARPLRWARSAAVARPLRWVVRSAGGLGGRRW